MKRFQSSPAPKDGCYLREALAVDTPEDISILTRPEGRVLHHCEFRDPRVIEYFNPHPPRRTGATFVSLVLPEPEEISILTRPEGRVLLVCVFVACR